MARYEAGGGEADGSDADKKDCVPYLMQRDHSQRLLARRIW